LGVGALPMKESHNDSNVQTVPGATRRIIESVILRRASSASCDHRLGAQLATQQSPLLPSPLLTCLINSDRTSADFAAWAWANLSRFSSPSMTNEDGDGDVNLPWQPRIVESRAYGVISGRPLVGIFQVELRNFHITLCVLLGIQTNSLTESYGQSRAYVLNASCSSWW
jgi:hypothetical protein